MFPKFLFHMKRNTWTRIRISVLIQIDYRRTDHYRKWLDNTYIFLQSFRKQLRYFNKSDKELYSDAEKDSEAQNWIELEFKKPDASVRYRSSRNKGDKNLPATCIQKRGLELKVTIDTWPLSSSCYQKRRQQRTNLGT
jgi:hypothetical protein